MSRLIPRLFATALLLMAGAAQAHTCATPTVQGAIGARYQQLGGSNGPLGCPLSGESNTPNDGRYVQFEHGQIARAPRQGDGMFIAAWQAGDSVMLNWGSTAIHFDKFQVRYDFNHRNLGQDDWAGGTRGQYQLNAMQAGNYGFSVQGCNGDCQGWDKTVEVFVDVANPQGVGGGLKVVSRLSTLQSTLFDRPGFFRDALNAAWSAARGPLCDQITQQAGVADGAGKGYTLYNIVCKLAPAGVLFLDDASGTTGAIDLTFDVPHNYIEATTTQPTVFGAYADPRFSLTYEIALHLRIDLANLKVLGVDYAAINASKPDSHNASADVLKALDALLQSGILRQARAAVQQSGSLDVDAINAALQRAGNPIAANLHGTAPSYAINNGDVTVTIASAMPVAQELDPNAGRERRLRELTSPPPRAPIAPAPARVRRIPLAPPRH